MELEEVADRLFADALAVDLAPAAAGPALAVHWSLLAEAGLLGVQARGGTPAAAPVLSALAGSCLSTALLWVQHEGATAAVATSALAEEVLPGLLDGTVRAGLALAGLRPGPDQLRARRVEDGWSLTGVVPWVTGLGIVDHLQVAAVDGEDVEFLLVPASTAGLTGEVQPLSAAAASATATARFDAVEVRVDRELRRMPLAEWTARQQNGVTLNGSLGLGVAERCARLMGIDDLDEQLMAVRESLASAEGDAIPAARAAASLLAVQAATGLAIATGSGAAVRGSHAERLVREAALLLVFASRPRIKAAMVRGWRGL